MTKRSFLTLLALTPATIFLADFLANPLLSEDSDPAVGPLLLPSALQGKDFSNLHSLIQNDFEQGRVQLIDGWVLSSTEAEILKSWGSEAS